MINNIPTKVLYQNVTKGRKEYIELHIGDEQDRSVDFNGNVLSFSLILA